MLASELISQLKVFIDENGDEDVFIVGDDDTFPIQSVTVATDGTCLLVGVTP